MLPRGIFRSRWVALLWAAGIVWTACDIAGSAPARPDKATTPRVRATDAPGDEVDPALAVLANAAGG